MNTTTKLLLVPIFTFGILVFLALYINNSYFIDPDYIYLLNGLNMFRGEWYSIVHVDHPGTPLQMLIGIFISIIGTLRGTGNISVDVISNPQLYIKIIIICIALLHSLVLFVIGKRYFKHQNSLINAILLQLSFLFFDTVTITFTDLFPDTIIPLGTLLIILVTIDRVWGTMKDRTYALLSGLILGVFIAVKITLLPLLVIPVIIATKWKNKLLIPVFTIIFFFVSILPIIDKFTHFKSFIIGIATHDGVYGTGNEEFLNIPKLLLNMWNIFQIEYTFTLIFILQLIFLIFTTYKNKFQSFKNKDFRVSIALFASIVLQLIIVSKHVGFRYLIPSLIISSFAFSIIINKLKSLRFVYFSILILISFLALHYNYKMISNALELKNSRNQTYAFVQSNISSNDALVVVTEESWFGSPFISHSLMFAKLYCYQQGEQYDDLLEEIYPNRFFWRHNNQQFSNWRLSVMPDLLLNQFQRLYIYIQTDNAQLYQQTITDFSINLKYANLGSDDLQLAFSNSDTDEKIYLLDVKSPSIILPKQKTFSSFEKTGELEDAIIFVSNDSAFIIEDYRFSEQFVFEGKSSICISPDNPYGISTTISNLKQNDFIHISIMCKRSSRRSECIIGMKSFIPEDGFSALGSTSTEIINGWEKLEYTYRFNYTPTDQKVIMFIWNNSNESMYFDNLNIQVY